MQLCELQHVMQFSQKAVRAFLSECDEWALYKHDNIFRGVPIYR